MNPRAIVRLIDSFAAIQNNGLRALPRFVTDAGAVRHHPSLDEPAFKSTLRTAQLLARVAPDAVDQRLAELVHKHAASSVDKARVLSEDEKHGLLDALRWLLFLPCEERSLKEYSALIKRIESANFLRGGTIRGGDCDHTIFLDSLYEVIGRWRHTEEAKRPPDLNDHRDRAAQRCTEEVYKQYALHAAGEYESFDLAQLVFALRPSAERLPRRVAECAIAIAARAFLARTSQLFAPYRVEKRDHHVRPIWQEVVAVLADAACAMMARNKSLCSFSDDLFRAIEFAAELADSTYLDEKDVPGWARSERPGAAEVWPTLAVVEMAEECIRLLRVRLLLAAREAYDFILEKPASPSREFGAFGDLPFGVHKVIAERFVKPERPTWSSAILFGPPGTGKTTLVKAIAKERGWWYVGITPADLAQEGPHAIVARARELFGMLSYVEGAVILFDEFDPFILTREEEEREGWWSSLVTNCMLPLLGELRESQRSIFLVATNFVDRLDRAATREGRFDALLPIWLPKKVDRQKVIQDFHPNGAKLPPKELSKYAAKSRWASWAELRARSQAKGPFECFEAAEDEDRYTAQLKRARPSVDETDYD